MKLVNLKKRDVFNYTTVMYWASILGFLFIFNSCENTAVKNDILNTSTPLASITDFPNILNLTGVPDSTTDRSVFMYSDLGAWHGYALPENSGNNFTGSFIGPFLMTQNNGVWISECLSEVVLIDTKRDAILNLKNAEILENNSYPNQLKQLIKLNDPPLLIRSELVFISDRTSLIKVDIKNLSKKDEIELELQWKGNSFLDGVVFSNDNNGVKIGFGKNKNIGLISVNEKNNFEINALENKYSIQYDVKNISPLGNWVSCLSHTFCFAEKELQQEKEIIEKAFISPNEYFSQSEKRWNIQINSVLQSIGDEFNDEAHHKIAVKCLETLNNNRRSPAGFLKYDGLFPSYNYEWFHGLWAWDSWKHAVALAQFDAELAQNQIRAMYHFQDTMGMIADCVYRDTVIENFNWRDTKPPLSAWAIWEVFKKSNDKNFLKEIFPNAEKYHEWWYKYRDHDQNGLCEYGSTDGSLIAAKWESGMDNAVRFDDTKIVRNNEHGWSMNRESVDLNAYLFAEKKYLSNIAEVLGEMGKSEQYENGSEKLKSKIQSIFYDEETGWFYDIDLDTKEQLKAYGAEGWIPLWSGAATKEQATKVRETMIDTAKFATYIPFPTLAADHPKFKADHGYWRGPIWIDQAYFAITGLRNYGYEEDALRFSHQLFDRLEGLKNADDPIWENYHPHAGEGMESKHFSWSAALLLMLLLGE